MRNVYQETDQQNPHEDISMGHQAKPTDAVGLLQGKTLLLDRTHMTWLASQCPNSGLSI